jgi:hypothetical protein
MPQHGFLEQLLARDPRSLARFPELPLEHALAAWHEVKAAGTATPPAPAEPAPAPAPAPAIPEELSTVVCSLATQVWRTKSKMIDPATGEPREDLKRIYRHVQGSIDALTQMDVTLNDWLNQPYDSGLPLKVLTFQPMPGMERDTIIEVLRPNVVWKGHLLQLGEVIVGVPEQAPEATATPTTTDPISP